MGIHWRHTSPWHASPAETTWPSYGPSTQSHISKATRLGRILLLRLWRGERNWLGSIAGNVLGRKTVCGVRGPKTQKWIYRRPMETQTMTEEYAKNALLAMSRMASLGNALCVAVGGGLGSSQRSTKNRNVRFTGCAWHVKNRKKCDLCERLLEEKEFSRPQWQRKQARQRICTACQKSGKWTCYVCKTRRLRTHFSRWEKKKRRSGRERATEV